MEEKKVVAKEQCVIQGLGGERKLRGTLEINGAKNAILPLMAASILFKDTVAFSNVPHISDVSRMCDLLEHVGAKTEMSAVHLSIDPANISKTELEFELSKRMRASIILAGPLLSRFGRVDFPHPGGCVIGARPIDIFIEGFEKMGAKVEEGDRHYSIKAKSGHLKGANIFFKLSSVTATESFLMAAVMAEGTSVLENCALEPEITDLAEFLASAGAKIQGIGTTTLTIVGRGGKLLSAPKKEHAVIPDRLEAGSFLILGALAASELCVSKCDPAHLSSLIAYLTQSGVPIEVGADYIRVKNKKGRTDAFKSFNIRTHEYPGFPTDLQAPTVVFLTQAEGESLVFETIFEGRLNFTEDLVRMGADIKLWDAHRATIKGPTPLRGKELNSPDIRAGLAFVIAALVASGESTINNMQYVDRGYERIEERLRSIGASLTRLPV